MVKTHEPIIEITITPTGKDYGGNTRYTLSIKLNNVNHIEEKLRESEAKRKIFEFLDQVHF